MPNSHNGSGETEKQVKTIQAINKHMQEDAENKKNEDIMSQDDIEKLLLSASEESIAPDVSPDASLPEETFPNSLKPEPGTNAEDIITLEDVDRIIDIVLESDIDLEIDDTETESSPQEEGGGDEVNVSQDDIDTLLNDVPHDNDAGSEIASQDDIDNLFQEDIAETPAQKDEGESDKSAPEEDGQAISQDDIDSILGREDTKDASETDEQDFVSQDDIDNLLQGITPEDQKEKETGDSQNKEPETISQDDIDSLLNDSPAEDAGDSDVVSQDDIDNLLKEDTTETQSQKDEEGSAGNDPEENSEVISQDDIDSLLSGEDTEETPEIKEQDVVSQDDIDNLLQGDKTETQPLKDGKDDGEKKERSHLIDQGELDRLIKAYEEKGPEKAPDEAVEQDSPTAEPDDVGDDTILVSQDEINKLIGDIQDAPDEEEPDQEKSSESAKSDGGDVISQDDIDKLLSIPEEEADDELDDIAGVSDSDKVILEAGKEDDTAGEAETLSDKKWFKNRYVVACAASFLIIISASLLLSVFRTPETNEETKKIMPPATLETAVQAPADPSFSDADKLINFKDFIVMAPLDREDITLITTHVSITLKDVGAADLIRENKAFFRGIVYNTVLESLILEDQKKSANELILTSGIKMALNKALPEASIQKVVLNDLNLI